MKVSIIGGSGHVGFALCLAIAEAGHEVIGIDQNQEKNELIMNGEVPFREENAEEFLEKALSENKLHMTDKYNEIGSSDIIIIVIGTPIDEYLNPVLSDLQELIRKIGQYIEKDQLLILRSTVAPGTTNRVKEILERETGLEVGKNLFLSFAPERVLEGKAIEEIKNLPQLIGAFDDKSYKKSEYFFKTFINSRCLKLSPVEAELGKLMTNMSRYVNFALANEFHLIADTFDANANKIIDYCNYNYDRLDLPSPGPNVGGPCLTKDGWFLLERIPYTELISNAFQINEGMPIQIVEKLEDYEEIEKIAILGMTYKANSDDIRNSVSFKLKKQLKARGYDLVMVEPNIKEFGTLSEIEGCDAVILMTPHEEFEDLEKILDLVSNPNCLYVDIWGFWEEMKYKSDNGYFLGKEVE